MNNLDESGIADSKQKGLNLATMSKSSEHLSPEALRELIVLRDESRKELYAENDPEEIRRLRRLIEQLELQIRRGYPPPEGSNR